MVNSGHVTVVNVPHDVRDCASGRFLCSKKRHGKLLLAVLSRYRHVGKGLSHF